MLPKKSKSFIFTQQQKDKLSNIEGVVSYSEIVEDNILMNCEDRYMPVTLKGIDGAYPKNIIESILTYGDWLEADLPQIVSNTAELSMELNQVQLANFLQDNVSQALEKELLKI